MSTPRPRLDRARCAAVAALAATVVVWSGLEVFEQYDRADPPRYFAAAPWQERDDTLALAKARRFAPFRDEVRGLERVGFVSDPAAEWVADRMLIQSLVAPTLVTDPKLEVDDEDEDGEPDPAVFIASFPDEATLEARLAADGEFTILRRLGDGLAVLERRGP